jgi:hypothetical protein
MSISTNPPTRAEKVTVDGTVVYIDRDLPWHRGRWPNESWWIVSNLDSDGQRIGLQLQFLIQTPPTGVELMYLNVVVVNETAGISRNFEYLYHGEQVELGADRMYISTPELTFSGDRNGCAVSVRGKDTRVEHPDQVRGHRHGHRHLPRAAGKRPRLPRTRRQLVLGEPGSADEFMVMSGQPSASGLVSPGPVYGAIGA